MIDKWQHNFSQSKEILIEFSPQVWGYIYKTIILTLICTTIISLSNVYVFRYLIEIIEIGIFTTILLAVFYGFTATNLLLSFTPESFTITVFFMSLMVYYYSYCIQKDKEVSLLPNIFFAITLGGITITNVVKGILPINYTKANRKNIFRKIFIISGIFFIIIFLVHLLSLFFLFNIFIHVIIGYGARDSFIYGGHWLVI